MMKNVCSFENDNTANNNLSQRPDSSESEWLECSFQKCQARWQQVNNSFSSQGFINEIHEIWFFKYIKPSFVGMLNYYALRYRNLLFRPASIPAQIMYYRREFARSDKFLSDHEEFCNYYKEGRSDRDKEYFKRTSSNASRGFGRPNNGNKGLSSPKDSLAADMITNRLYKRYLAKLLSAFNISCPGNVIAMHNYGPEDFRNVAGFH